jgi:4a-hydroxytetrahydrobiopterin dehydratase
MSDKKIDLLLEFEIQAFLDKDKNWSYEDNKLKAKFELSTFEEAIAKLNTIAAVCTEMNHHPLVTNVYNRLMFSIATHSAGDRVTGLDVQLATRISEIIESK